MDKGRADAFQVLGIPADSDAEAVAHAYRRLARVTHPDVSADPEAANRFATLAAAYRLATQASEAVGGSASTGRSGLLFGGPAFRDCHSDDGQTSDGALRWWGSVPEWSMPLGPTPRGGHRQQAPIVAGPVFVSPTRHAGPGGVRDG